MCTVVRMRCREPMVKKQKRRVPTVSREIGPALAKNYPISHRGMCDDPLGTEKRLRMATAGRLAGYRPVKHKLLAAPR